MKLIALLMMAADLNGQPLPEVVLLDFTAGYCAPCQQMMPVLQRMEKDNFPIRKIDITENPDASRKYGVDRIPTLILLVNGKEERRFVGLTAESELRQAMNGAARRLDLDRKTAMAPDAPADAGSSVREPNVPNTAPESSPEKQTPADAGSGGFFDRIKRGLTGSPTPRPKPERPDFRAQSPQGDADRQTGSLPMQATVRVRVTNGNLLDSGTGTLIHSTAGSSIVATCAHLFMEVSDDAAVVVDVFRDGKVLNYPATVVGGNHDADVAILQIQNREKLPHVPVAFQRDELAKDESVFSIGCSNGSLPTKLDMQVIEVNRYIGPANILCTNAPSQGRSGGGLFDSQNRLVGICSAADRKAGEGLYAGSAAVADLLNQLNLMTLFSNTPPAFAVTEQSEKKSEIPPNPFEEADESVFDELFAETPPTAAQPNINRGTGGSGSSGSGSSGSGTSGSGTSGAAHSNTTLSQDPPRSALPDPFANADNFSAAPARVVRTATNTHGNPTGTTTSAGPAGGSRGASTGTEVTVIIDSKDGRGKQVIVIPRPSPWLLNILTGEAPAASVVETTPQRALSVTSSRRNLQH